MEANTMPQIIDFESNDPETQRADVRLALNEIAVEVGIALRAAHLIFPVYLTVPNSGRSLANMVCPLDPSDKEWSRATSIVCGIIGKRLGDIRLRARSMIGAMANSTMGAADVTADVDIEP
jgi:hypothetical protein